ncbi:Not1-domain-containing protein, partial [Dipodascopsis uninucleata]
QQQRASSSSPSLSSSGVGGGGGGSSTSSSSSLGSRPTELSKIVGAQIVVLVSTIKEDKWDTTVKQIRQLCDQNIPEVFEKYFRRLITISAPSIFQAPTRPPENPLLRRLLAEELSILANDPSVSFKFSNSISSFPESANTSTEILRDFNIQLFFDSFQLNLFQRFVLSISLLQSTNKDLKVQAIEFINNNFQSFINTVSDSSQLTEQFNNSTALVLLNQLFDSSTSIVIGDIKKRQVFLALRQRFHSEDSIPLRFRDIAKESHNMDSILKRLVQMGPSASASLESLQFISKFQNNITEEEITEIMQLLASSPGWNGLHVGMALAEPIGKATHNFTLVFSRFDESDFIFEDSSRLAAVLNFFKGLSVSSRVYKDFITYAWKHSSIQISILQNIIILNKDQFDLSQLDLAHVISASDFNKEEKPQLYSMAQSLESQNLNFLDIVDSLIHLVLREDAGIEAKILVDRVAKLTPELLVLGAVQLPTPWEPLQEDIIYKLLDLFMSGHGMYQLVFDRLWQTNNEFFTVYLINAHARDNNLIIAMASIIADIGCIDDLVLIKPYFFPLDLFCYLSRRGLYTLQTYLDRVLAADSQNFLIAVLDFLDIKSTAEYSLQQQQQQHQHQQDPHGYADLKPTSVSLHVKAVYDLLQLLLNHTIPPEQVERWKLVQTQCIQTYPRLINFGRGHDSVILQNSATNGFSTEVEKQMKYYYQKMYEQEMTISDVIALLQKFRVSDDPTEQDVFACMVHSLFDEYRFFPDYPLSALATTAVLFGSIIQFHLVEDMALSIALRYVLEALKESPDTKMFKFGLQALMQFQSRLDTFPQYCLLLLQIPSLEAVQPQLMTKLRTFTNRSDSSPVDDSSKREDSNTSPPPPAFRSLHLDSVSPSEQPSEDPNEDIQDKVLFIVNNVAPSNIDQKALDLKELLEEKYHQWFASYLVDTRAKQEPNYHSLYIQMLDVVNDNHLNRQVLHFTYARIISLLNSNETMQSSTERGRLKNLGCWLGCLTIAKDKPIKHKNISFKDLLVEGFETNRLIVVLPFTCKVLEQAVRSRIFKPPNPWLVGILMLMIELYQFADLKLNLKFEIEVLCKNLSVDITSLEPSTIIRDRPSKNSMVAVTPDMNHDFDRLSSLASYSGARGDGRGPRTADAISITQSPVMNYPLVANNGSWATNPAVKKIVQVAVDKAIRELITPVAERSDTIAQIATKELITKDFALEGDEEKMRRAAHNMIHYLASSLAMVTCREPLKLSMTSNIRSLLTSNGISESVFGGPEGINQIVLDNLDAACAVIEKAAVEKTIVEIDEVLSAQYMARRRHRELHPNQPFFDSNVSRYAMSLPDPFRLKPGGLTRQQMMVYEDFGKFKVPETVQGSDYLGFDYNNQMATQGHVGRQASIRSQAQQMNSQQSLAAMGLQARQETGRSASVASNGKSVPLDQAMAAISSALDTLVKLIKESPESSYEQLPMDHRIKVALASILQAANRHPLKDQVIHRTSQLAIMALFASSETPLLRETLAYLITRLCDLSSLTAKEVVLWLIHVEDERKFNAPVMITLIKMGLIHPQELDVSLSKQILSRRHSAIEFISSLIREAVLGAEPCALRTDFMCCLEAMEVLASEQPPEPAAQQLLTSLQNSGAVKTTSLKEQMKYIFSEWIRLTQHPAKNEKMFYVFIFQMSERGLLDDTKYLGIFFRSALEFCVESYNKDYMNRMALTGVMSKDSFIAIDSLAKLVVMLIRIHEDNEHTNKIQYLRGIMSVICLVFAHTHETQGDSFNSQPFFRLFSSILCEWREAEDKLTDYKEQFYTFMAEIFKALQPLAFPGFTFAWMTLISHRMFMPKILQLEQKKGWATFVELLEAHLRFIGIHLVSSELQDSIRFVYKGTLRIFLVLLHDFPEFLAEYHYTLCNSMPTSCIQLRNLVLSAFPQNMSLPDPFAHGFKVDRLPEIKQAPVMARNPEIDLHHFGLKKFVDAYLESTNASSISLKPLVNELTTASQPELGLGFNSVSTNVAALDAIVLYVGMQAIAESKSQSPDSLVFNTKSNHIMFLTKLLLELGAEGRYFFLGAVANQLRYPNSHTHHFSCVLLYLFGSAPLGNQQLDIQQQITRVLLERLICHRPHPWGLLITFTELLKNSTYNFWGLPFTKYAPEIERLFSSLFSHINS